MDYSKVEVLGLYGFDKFKLHGRVFNRLSLVTLRKLSIRPSKFINNFITKVLMLDNGLQYTVHYPICWPLGRPAKERSQNRNSCKMRAYFWPWLVLSLFDEIIFC